MDTGSVSLYQYGLTLVEQGKHAEAVGPLTEHLAANPHDIQAINDTGAVLYCLGRLDEAARCLERAFALQPASAEVIWNLVEIYLAMRQPEKLMPLLPLMDAARILTPDLLNRAANAFLDKEDTAGAVEMLLLSLRIAPTQDVLRPMLDVIRTRRPKIAFFCGMGHDVKFLKDILEYTSERFPVKVFEGATIEEMTKLMKWSDISWFEWCTDMPVKASRLEKTCKMIIRLHRFEAYEEWPAQVNWANVDRLILVGNSAVKAALLKQVPDIDRRTEVVTIANGIHLDRYAYSNRPRGKNIACIGHINTRKNPMFLLQCMQKLHYIDPAYRLHFAGDFQDAMLEQYVRDMVENLSLKDVVSFDGWQNNVAGWLADKHYIVSTSIGESQGLGILEGMACGLRPVIHRFPGVGEIFPMEYVFNIAEEFCSQITGGAYEPARYRRFVEETYPVKKQLDSVNGIFTAFEADVAERVYQPV
jgi:glycosyltransferase involved in cell wall biosynthesis